MKTLPFLLITVFFCHVTQAQITYNFETKKLTIPDSCKNLKEGKSVNLEIENINLMLYKVKVEHVASTFHADEPEIFSTYFTSLTSLESILKLFTGDKTNSGNSDSDNQKESTQFKYFENIDTNSPYAILLLNYVRMKNTVEAMNEIMAYSQIIEPEIDSVKRMDELIKNLNSQRSLFTQSYYQIALKNQLDSTQRKLADTLFKEVEQKKLGEYVIRAKIFSKNYQSSTTYTSAPIFAKGDELAIGIKISPRTKDSTFNYVPLTTDSFSFNIFVKRRLRTSFSTGLFMSGLAHEQFVLKPQYNQDTIGGYKLANEGGLSASFGPVAHLHISLPFFDTDFRAGINMGVGLSIEENPIPQYMLGLSCIMGKKERVILNIGACAGYVQRLSASMYPDYTYKEKPTLDYTHKLEFSGAFSLSYNLIGNSAEKKKK